MKFAVLVATFVCSSAEAARLGLLRIESTTSRELAHRSIFEEDSALYVTNEFTCPDLTMEFNNSLFRQLFGGMADLDYGSMSMSLSMSMSVPKTPDVPYVAPSTVPTSVPTFLFDLEGAANADEFQQAQTSKQASTTSSSEASSLGAGTTAMIAVLSVAGLAVVAAVAARKIHKANHSSGSISESSILSNPVI